MVMDEMAIRSGKRTTGITSRSMTTEVSSNPAGNRSGTRTHVLIENLIHVLEEASPIQRRRSGKDCSDRMGVDEAIASQRPQLPDRLGMSGDDETPTLFELSHDATAVIAKFTLTDDFTHIPSVAPCATLGDLTR